MFIVIIVHILYNNVDKSKNKKINFVIELKYIKEVAYRNGIGYSYSLIREGKKNEIENFLKRGVIRSLSFNLVRMIKNRAFYNGVRFQYFAYMRDPKLQEWVHRENYLGENKYFLQNQLIEKQRCAYLLCYKGFFDRFAYINYKTAANNISSSVTAINIPNQTNTILLEVTNVINNISTYNLEIKTRENNYLISQNNS